MQQPNRKNGCLSGCLVVAGVAVGLIFIIGGIIGAVTSANSPSTQSSATQLAHTSRPRGSGSHKERPQPTSTPEVNYCDRASTLEQDAVTAYNTGRYRTAYNDTTNGLLANDSCNDEDDSIVNEGYLLSVKGLSEHYLPEGDSRTDLNQANQVLVECQTRPGLYGTHTAAGCETQEQNNIHQQTTWEMDSGG